jgi:type II secretory pathway pseudopilin PulG
VRRLREESGHTLVELLAAMSLMILVIGSTLGAFDTFGRNTATNDQLNEAQSTARIALDRMARELRNASAYGTDPSPGVDPSAVLRAQPWDLVFQSVDPLTVPAAGAGNNLQLQRVRYCLDTATNVLFRQRQTWTTATAPVMPSGADCPAAGWTEQSPVARWIVNSGTRRLFTYNQMNPADVSAATPALSDISSIRANVYVDVNGTRPPAETQLATGVHLRNKNRRPVVSCVATAAGPMHASLNGTSSTDPEGEALKFGWKDGTTPLDEGGPIVDYTAPTAGAHTFSLTVTDVGGLTATATCTPAPLTIQ